jgi:hypothetical protein
MRLTLAAICVATCTSMASAQTQSEQKQPADSQHSTGRTVLPDDNKGQLQPQGWTGPITTGSGGATPAASPQGQSPPGLFHLKSNVRHHSSSGLRTYPWLSTTLPSCEIGT